MLIQTPRLCSLRRCGGLWCCLGTSTAGCSPLSELSPSLWRDAVYNGCIRALIESLTHQPLAAANEGIQGIRASIIKFDFWMWLCLQWALVRVFRKCDRVREEVTCTSCGSFPVRSCGQTARVPGQPGHLGRESAFPSQACTPLSQIFTPSLKLTCFSAPTAVFSSASLLLSLNPAISFVDMNALRQNHSQSPYHPSPIDNSLNPWNSNHQISDSFPFFLSLYYCFTLVQAFYHHHGNGPRPVRKLASPFLDFLLSCVQIILFLKG